MLLIASDDSHFDRWRSEAERLDIVMLKCLSEDDWPSDLAVALDRSQNEPALRVLGRTFLWLADRKLAELVERSCAAVAHLLKDVRRGNLYGPLLAGAWTLQADHMPGGREMLEWCGTMGVEALHQDEWQSESVDRGRQVLSVLLDTTEMIGSGSVEVSVRELVAIADGRRPHAPISKNTADKHLRNIGLRLHHGDLHLANENQWIARRLRAAGLADNCSTELRKLPGVRAGGVPMRFRGLQSRTTAIPLDILRTVAVPGSSAPRQRTG